jgi:hypothetical protein
MKPTKKPSKLPAQPSGIASIYATEAFEAWERAERKAMLPENNPPLSAPLDEENERYTDPLGLNEIPTGVAGDSSNRKSELIPTGLDDQEDAHRYMAMRFNPNLLFCPNCELCFEHNLKGTFDSDMLYRAPNGEVLRITCPLCGTWLDKPGTPATKARWKTPQW